MAIERDEDLRQQWRDMQANEDFLPDGSQFVCLDETSKNELTYARRYGRAYSTTLETVLKLEMCLFEVIGICYDFSSFHQRASSSCRTVVSLHPCSTTLIDSAVCFIITPFTYTCLPFVFRRMYFIHAISMPIFYLLITCHASMAHSYINCL